MFLVIKNNHVPIKIPERAYLGTRIYYANSLNDPCVLKGCYTLKANQIALLSQVGVLHNNQLSSNGKSGYLFYGPYVWLGKGTYSLILNGNFQTRNSAVIDIHSNKSARTYYQKKICNPQCLSNKLVIPFKLKENVSDLEIRLYVNATDKLTIFDYKIVFR